jgi:ArpU family phage transcriptional regulator
VEHIDKNNSFRGLDTMKTLLSQIDKKATKKKAEEAFEQYRILLLGQREEDLPKVTTTYSLVPPSHTNAFHSSTEDIAIKRVDYERQRIAYLKKVVMAVNRLSFIERAILIQCYMLKDDMKDYEVYSDLSLSQRDFYRKKGKALVNFAVAMRIEVYKEDETE